MISVRVKPGSSRAAFKSFVENLYFVVQPCRPCVWPARFDTEAPLFLSPKPLPGMRNMLKESEAVRSTFLIDVEVLLAGALMGSVDTVLRPCYSLKQFELCKEQILAERTRVLSGMKASGSRNIRHTEIQIGLYAQSSLQLYESSDAYLRSKVARKTRFNTTMFEWQIGQAYLKMADVLSLLPGSVSASSELNLPLYGNNAGLIDIMTDPVRNGVKVVRNSNDWTVKPMLTADGKGALFLDPAFVAKTKQALLDFYAGPALKTVEQHADLMSKFQAMYSMRFKKTANGIEPGTPLMRDFHVQSWDHYALPEQLPGSTAFRLPIWWYNWPRQVNVTSDNGYRGLLERRIAFMVDCYKDVNSLYFGPADTASSTKDLVSAIDRWFGTARDGGKTAPFTDSDRLTLVALTDFLSTFITYAAMNGKYRSDLGVNAKKTELVPSESCDCHRRTGSACSGDCEEFEGVTQEMYFMVYDFCDWDSVHSTNGAQATWDPHVIRALRAVSMFVRVNYEYVSLSGACTSAFPGMDIDERIASLNYDSLANSSTESADTNFLRSLRPDSKLEKSVTPSFHQYSILLPVVTMDRLSRANETATVDSPARKYPAPAAVTAYYAKRVAEFRAASSSGFVPPPILLESTSPLSSLLLGASIYVDLPMDNPVTMEAACLDETVAKKATKLKQSTISIFEDIFEDPRTRDCHPLKRILSRGRVMIDLEHRYCSPFYRPVDHGINVTYIKRAQTELSAVKPESKVSNQIGADAYVTFISGTSGKFGVDLEAICLAHLPVDSHPMAVKTENFFAYTLSAAPAGFWDSLDQLQADLELFERLPPANFGAISTTREGEIVITHGSETSSGSKIGAGAAADGLQTATTYARQVLTTHIILLRGGMDEDPNSITIAHKEKRLQKIGEFARQNGCEKEKTCLKVRLFPLFGPLVEWISLDGDNAACALEKQLQPPAVM